MVWIHLIVVSKEEEKQKKGKQETEMHIKVKKIADSDQQNFNIYSLINAGEL